MWRRRQNRMDPRALDWTSPDQDQWAFETYYSTLLDEVSHSLSQLNSGVTPESFREFVGADTAANTVGLRPGLLEAVESANINDILLLEVRGLIGAQA